MTTVNFSVGPPPQPAYIAKDTDGNQIYQPNPQFWQWINLMWKWSTLIGNNANFSITAGTINTSGYVFASGTKVATGQILGQNVSASIYGQSNTAAASTYDTSLFGYNGNTGGTGNGHIGTAGVVASTASSAIGVFGYASAGQGVLGYSDASGGNGVRGKSTHASGYGMVAENTSGTAGAVALAVPSGVVNISNLTASQVVVTDANKSLQSLGVTGTAGSVVLSISPTFTGTLSAATISASGNVTGANLSGTNTGDSSSVSAGSANGSSGGAVPAITNKATDNPSAWNWLKCTAGPGTIYIPYMQ